MYSRHTMNFIYSIDGMKCAHPVSYAQAQTQLKLTSLRTEQVDTRLELAELAKKQVAPSLGNDDTFRQVNIFQAWFSEFRDKEVCERSHFEVD